ncbi:adenine nucleotide alpha hydrolase [Telmatospirillum sp. J64-1]|uniref:adenine nucleotide alpha hydrolase n=1 Tax=Telmatospirillum sp. J64-1 TaxID=2502183 RepID=UPI00115E48EA|nr:adenine nucleotide alpha hydrolase [Telmatospirillum sp. J64-1]
MKWAEPYLSRLLAFLDAQGPLAIAVSGGVDSMTLASVAHRYAAEKPLMIHAVSPAVPSSARDLLLDHAQAEGWDLSFLDAGEQDDSRYRANPYDRCYFCKSNLYASIRKVTARTIASGTNLDDLGDYRPGLQAAKEHGVVHPFVMAGIDKAAIREIARRFGFSTFSELPAQPCLASRVETGIRIDPLDLRFVDEAEKAVRDHLGERHVIRVRLRRQGVFLEISCALSDRRKEEVAQTMRRLCLEYGRVFMAIEDYRQGAAFVDRKA